MGAPFKETTLYMGPSLDFHANSGQGRYSLLSPEACAALVMAEEDAELHLWHVVA